MTVSFNSLSTKILPQTALPSTNRMVMGLYTPLGLYIPNVSLDTGTTFLRFSNFL